MGATLRRRAAVTCAPWTPAATGASTGSRLLPVLPLDDSCLFPGASLALVVDQPAAVPPPCSPTARAARCWRSPGGRGASARATSTPSARSPSCASATPSRPSSTASSSTASPAPGSTSSSASTCSWPRRSPRGGRRGRRVGPRRRGARTLPPRPRRPARVPRAAAPVERADGLGEPRLPAPADHPPPRQKLLEANAPERCLRDRPRPRRAAAEGADDLRGAVRRRGVAYPSTIPHEGAERSAGPARSAAAVARAEPAGRKSCVP